MLSVRETPGQNNLNKGATHDNRTRIPRIRRRTHRPHKQTLTDNPNQPSTKEVNMIPLPIIIGGITAIYNIVDYIVNNDK